MDEQLSLPTHQIRATRPERGLTEFEFFLNERTETHWVSRRHPGLTQPISSVEMTSSLGVPILSPEIQLLFKAKYSRQKDQADFESVFPRLNSIQTAWLTAALRDYHPDHPWIEAMKTHSPPADAE